MDTSGQPIRRSAVEASGSVGTWPADPGGRLSKIVFPPAYLGALFFDVAPRRWNCTAAVMRRALKAFVKRHGPLGEEPNLAGLKGDERDSALIGFVCDHERLRQKFRTIELLKDSRQGAGSRKRAIRTSDFAETVWDLGFRYNPDEKLAALGTWFWGAAQQEAMDDRRFVRRESLIEALAAHAPPVPIGDIAFTRSLLLYGSLLDPSEMEALFEAAVALGAWIPPDCRASLAVASELPVAAHGEPSLPESSLPRLQTPEVAPLVAEKNSAANDLIRKLARANERRETAADAALASFGVGLPVLVSSASTEFERAMTQLKVWRVEDAALQSASAEAELWLDKNCQAVEDKTGVSLILGSAASHVERLDAVASAVWASQFFDVSDPICQAWRNALEPPVDASEFLHLAEIYQALNASEQAERAFDQALARQLPAGRPEEVAAWLSDMSALELVLLTARSIQIGGWTLLALLVAYGVERHGAAFAETVAVKQFTTLTLSQRRQALRFIQRSTARLDGAPTFRRYVCREHLSDLLQNGPLAQIADTSAGTADLEVVGRNLMLAVETITANLDIITSTPDIAKRLSLSRLAADNTAAKAAIEFIRTPAGMSGHFHRLRENAREWLLLPLVVDDGLNVRGAKSLLGQIISGESENFVFDETGRQIIGGERLQSQHRTQLARYLQAATKQLEAAVRAEAISVDARTTEFADRLSHALEAMAEGGPAGSVAWLEAEFVALLGELSERSVGTSLTGDERSLLERLWTPDDDAWRDRSVACIEFYSDQPSTHWAVLCGLLAAGPHELTEIVDTLLERQDFSGALKAALEAGGSAGQRGLRKQVEEAASPHLRKSRSKLEDLIREYGNEAVVRSEGYKPLQEALRSLRVADAGSFASYLEAELDEAREKAGQTAAEAQERVAAADLLARLLRAGDPVVQEDQSLVALRQRWATVLIGASGRREHLLAVQAVLKPITPEFAEFAPLLPQIDELSARAEDPEWWLSEDVAAELVSFLKDTLQKLGVWTGVLNVLPSGTRRALGEQLSVLLSFLYDRTAALRSASNRDEIDSVLESVIEFDVAAGSQSSPEEGLQALHDAGLAANAAAYSPQMPDSTRLLGPGRRQADDFARTVANAVSVKAWQELYLLAINARSGVPEDEIQRIDEVADFAQWTQKLGRGDRTGAYELSDGAARAVCTSGHPIQRALAGRERQTAILQILDCVLAVESAGVYAPRARPAWTDFLNSQPHLFRVEESAGHQSTRVLTALFSSAQAFDLADQVWSAATNASDAAAIRADLLLFLHEHGQFETFIRLCGKYDPSIKSKIEQMLELRIASSGRPDLVPVAEAVGVQVAKATKLAPVKQFLARLPTTIQAGQGELRVHLQDELVVRSGPYSRRPIQVSVTIVPEAIVPSSLQVQLIAEDDVGFAGRSSRLMVLTEELLYAPKDFTLDLILGVSWDQRIQDSGATSFRLRFSAKTVTDTIVTTDLDVGVTKAAEIDQHRRSIDTESILEFYPGVGNTPAVGDAFVGRTDSLEQLHNFLVAARQPSPVLLTGMRRVGKTSLLQQFHSRHSRPGGTQAVTVYLSISELRQQFLSREVSVSTTLYRAIGKALAKREYSATDHNRALGERLKSAAADRDGMRAVVQACEDTDSLSDSLMLLTDRVIEAVGNNTSRMIVLLDEAESLIVPYNLGGEKKVELEQLLQSLREVSQTSDRFAMVLSGSNHITAFAREYKNAFFGSCVRMELEGLTSFDEASRLIAPPRVADFVEFDPAAIRYGVELCAGMPQFMWQLGAATVYAVRSGKVLRPDVRTAVGALVNGDHTKLPFKSYDILEPIEHMLGLQGDREQDLLWLLLRRVALTSSLSALNAPRHFLLESDLLELDSRASWRRRLQTLVDLKILVPEGGSSYRFKVPLFAQGFRAERAGYDAEARLRKLAT